jgi:ABC-2 type transport system permease protein
VSTVRLLIRQVRYTNKAFWRNPAAAFFTFAFPLLFLVIFTALLGRGTVRVGGIPLEQSRYYVAAMASFSVVTACYTNIAMTLAYHRDEGLLKRIRGTPLPAWVYLVGRIVHAMAIALLLVALTVGFGALAYGAEIPSGAGLVRLALVVLVGGASFAALALATTALVPNADAGPAVVNAIALPLMFLSGVFIPFGDEAPAWVRTVAALFPVRHFADAMRAASYGFPFSFRWADLLAVAAWGLAGLALAVRFFSWQPRR